MKKLILTVMMCCFLVSVSNAIWLPALFPQAVSCWDENGHCHKCSKTGDPEECRKCEKEKNKPAPTDETDDEPSSEETSEI